MSVWLTLFLSILATAGVFAGLYGAIWLATSRVTIGKRPKLGLTRGEKPGQIGVWVTWDPGYFGIQIYRLLFSLIDPNSEVKERRFTVTFDQPQKKPFWQMVELPSLFKNLFEEDRAEKALITVMARTVDESPIEVSTTLEKMKKVLTSGSVKAPSEAAKLEARGQDAPDVMSQDYSELVERKKKIDRLIAEAKAKEQKKAAAAKAAAAKAAATKAEPPQTPPAPTAKPQSPPPTKEN